MLVRRLRFTVDAAAADRAAEALAEAGVAFQQHDQGTLEPPPAGAGWLTIYAPAGDADDTRAAAAGALAAADVDATLDESELDDDVYRDAWKAHFRPRPVGPFVLVPSWERYEPREGETVIDLDPGRAFGTGGHASTRLCLRALGRLDGCRRFLDVGSGSGVLAIACARRYPAATGVAIDNDPEAVAVTRENAEGNRVLARISVEETPLAEVPGAFDVVLANLTAETIALLAAPLAAHVAPSGRLIASGILAVQADDVARALAAVGLALSATEDEDEWRGMVFVPRGEGGR